MENKKMENKKRRKHGIELAAYNIRIWINEFTSLFYFIRSNI